jgi:hypothetical protein
MQHQQQQSQPQAMQHMSAEKLRSLLFAQGVEERVEVNQRHLIDKILARYRYHLFLLLNFLLKQIRRV